VAVVMVLGGLEKVVEVAMAPVHPGCLAAAAEEEQAQGLAGGKWVGWVEVGKVEVGVAEAETVA